MRFFHVRFLGTGSLHHDKPRTTSERLMNPITITRTTCLTLALAASSASAQIGGSGRDGAFTPSSNTTLDTTANQGRFECIELDPVAGIFFLGTVAIQVAGVEASSRLTLAIPGNPGLIGLKLYVQGLDLGSPLVIPPLTSSVSGTIES